MGTRAPPSSSFRAVAVTFALFCLATAADSANATCGNDIVEAGEDCDDKSSCCVSCKLAPGAQCTPGLFPFPGNGCCNTDTCLWEPSTKACPLDNNVNNIQGSTCTVTQPPIDYICGRWSFHIPFTHPTSDC